MLQNILSEGGGLLRDASKKYLYALVHLLAASGLSGTRVLLLGSSRRSGTEVGTTKGRARTFRKGQRK